jgi:ubiquitin-protein ligase
LPGRPRTEPVTPTMSLHQDAHTANLGTLKAMHQSPRIRRLYNDLAALERLRSESSVFRFTATGSPPQLYRINFSGKGLWRDDRGRVRAHEQHHVVITLGASYPRSMPEIRWSSKIFHPNISEIGMVCLGGYGTHWVPSVQLDDLCVMLWDMVRYHNYDIRSPYNRESALWAAGQTEFQFPTDSRPLRDLRAMQGRDDGGEDTPGKHSPKYSTSNPSARTKSANTTPVSLVLQFLERYGRGSGVPPSGDSQRRNFTEVMARMYPEGSRAVQSTERPSNLMPKADAPGPLRSEVVTERIDPSVEQGNPATAPEVAGHAGSDVDPNDMLILEASPDDLPRETPRDGDDEVMFIG